MRVLYLVALTGCGGLSSSELTIDRVDPPSGANTSSVPVRIEGSAFHIPITSNVDTGETITAPMAVTFGDIPISDVVWRGEQLVEGTVPAGLPLGSYDVTVVIGTLSDVLVAGYAVTGPCTLACPLGCDASGMRCVEVVPSNGIDPSWVGQGTADLVATTDLTIDSDAGTIVPAVGTLVYHQVPPADCGGGSMVGIGVFSFRSITIPDGLTVRVVGSRAVALLSAQAIDIAGVIDAGGGLATPSCADPPRCAGPGGFDGGLYDAFNPEVGRGPGGGGPGYSANGTGDEPGGGGGASCGAGGRGGDVANVMYPPGEGGTTYGGAAIIPLCGGSGGGAGGPASYVGDPGSRGGGGGGAIQLVSAESVTIRSTSLATPSGITTGGGGGQGDKAATIDDGGGGGGAGGAILIEAPVIIIAADAGLAANGGGGGGGYNNGAIAIDGGRGQLSTIPSPGGPGIRRGGNGGGGAMLAGEAAPGPSGDGGAGGGGGIGRIRLNARDAASLTTAGQLSPMLGTCASTGTVNTQ